MKQLLTLAFACFAALSLTAQQYNTFTVAQIPCVQSLSGQGTPLTLADDNWSPRLDMGFSFCYFANNYDSINVGSNSCLSFNNVTGQYKPFSVPAPGNFAGIPQQLFNGILAPMQDIHPGMGGQVRYHTDGVAPDRRFVVEYDSVPYFGGNAPDSTFSAQIVLFETTNIIEIHLLSRPMRQPGMYATGLMAFLGPHDPNNIQGYTFGDYWGQWAARDVAFRFTPYGPCGTESANLIQGNIYFDQNQDCVRDTSDNGLGGSLVVANGGNIFTWADPLGNYTLAVDTGTFVVEHIPQGYYGTLCPGNGNYTINFANMGNISGGNDFADTARVCDDLYVDIASWLLRRCRTNTLYVEYGNMGTVSSTPTTLTLVMPDSVYFVSSNPAPDVVNGNTLIWNIGALAPNTHGNIVIVDSVDCGATLGVIRTFTADILSGHQECDLANNNDVDADPVVDSWDPNDIRTLSRLPAENGFVYQEDILVDEVEHVYMIRFQNSGNDTAFNVRIEDMLPAELDGATIIPGVSSHPYQFFRYGNEIRFYFNNIMLPYEAIDEPGSNGFVQFTIRQVPNNPIGTEIRNEANIYFDMNVPVLTNQSVLRITSPVDVPTVPTASQLTVYPNPADRAVTIQKSEAFNGDEVIRLYDMLGQRVAEFRAAAGHTATVPVSNLAAGLYLISIENQSGVTATARISVR